MVGIQPGGQVVQLVVQLSEPGAQSLLIPFLLEHAQGQKLIFPLVAQAEGLRVFLLFEPFQWHPLL